MLIIPENVADIVRERVARQTPLTANEILFNASHTHSGPGAFGPGFASKAFNGTYDPQMPDILATIFTQVIVKAYEALEPSKVAHGGVDVPQYITNRSRQDGPVDSELSYMLVEQDDGDRCFVVSYSAHPTILGADNMEFSGDYPGYLMRSLRERSGAEAIYLGGALGSMSHRAPEAADPFQRCDAMGTALAERVLASAEGTQSFQDKVDVASVGVGIELPPFQVRLNKSWRISKLLPPLLGVDNDGWMHAVRIGDVVLVGTPADYCGELSVQLKSWAADRSMDFWVLSFNGDYAGYISPDKYYYDKEPDGGYGYERGLMSWIGPDQEAFTVSLIRHMTAVLFPDRRDEILR